MKILIKLKHDRVSGVNTFCKTLCKYLVKNHHKVTVVADEGSGSNLRKLFKIWPHKIEVNPIVIDDDFDLAILNYSNHQHSILNPNCKKIFVCHGAMEELYVPPPDMDKYVFMSKRSCNFFSRKLSHVRESDKTVIKNPIDIDIFQSNTSGEILPRFPKRISIVDARNAVFTLTPVISACSKLNIAVDVVGNTKHFKANIDNNISAQRIQESDMVIGVGRCAYESLCVGKPTIVYGSMGGDGTVTRSNYERLCETNMSGWSFHKLPRPEDCDPKLIISEIEKYDPQESIRLSEIVRNDVNYMKVCSEIIK